jgi:hypothetical protein
MSVEVNSGTTTSGFAQPWMHYSLVNPKNTFHRKLRDCAVTCLQEVPKIKADFASAAKVRDISACCPALQK